MLLTPVKDTVRLFRFLRLTARKVVGNHFAVTPARVAGGGGVPVIKTLGARICTRSCRILGAGSLRSRPERLADLGPAKKTTA